MAPRLLQKSTHADRIRQCVHSLTVLLARTYSKKKCRSLETWFHAWRFHDAACSSLSLSLPFDSRTINKRWMRCPPRAHTETMFDRAAYAFIRINSVCKRTRCIYNNQNAPGRPWIIPGELHFFMSIQITWCWSLFRLNEQEIIYAYCLDVFLMNSPPTPCNRKRPSLLVMLKHIDAYLWWMAEKQNFL